jgi:8-oxo-dGTP pyrophosphatase MutT (NUDIX family)
MRSDNPWKVTSSKVVYQNPWMQVHEDTVVTPTGNDGIYGYIESKDSVMITVLNDENELYLVRTFSYPDASWNWELPGGGGDGEAAAIASRRELEEETGILANNWDKLGEARVCNGLMTERMAVYLATGISFTGEKETSDEQIDTARFFPLAEVNAMIERSEINDCQSITGIHLMQKWLARKTES